MCSNVLDVRFVPVTADYFKQNLLRDLFLQVLARDERIVRFAVEEAVAMHGFGLYGGPDAVGRLLLVPKLNFKYGYKSHLNTHSFLHKKFFQRG